MKNDVIHLEFINIHIDIVTDGLMVRDEKKLHFYLINYCLAFRFTYLRDDLSF